MLEPASALHIPSLHVVGTDDKIIAPEASELYVQCCSHVLWERHDT